VPNFLLASTAVKEDASDRSGHDRRRPLYWHLGYPLHSAGL